MRIIINKVLRINIEKNILLLRFTSKIYYLLLTAFFADVLRQIFCSPPLFTHGKFLVGRVGQMPGVYPTMTPQKPHSVWLSRVSSRTEGNIKPGFTKTDSRKKGPCWPSRAAPVFVHLRIFPRRA